MSWLEFVPPLLMAAAVMFGPGFALGFAAGARRFTLWAVAPAITVAFLSVLAIVYGRLGIEWAPLPIAAALVVVSVPVGVAGQLVRRRAARLPRTEPPVSIWTFVSLAIAAVIIGTQLVIGLGAPDRISQTFDAFFHLNGVRYILDTGSASSFDIQGLVLPEGAHAFYPAGWHAVTSLVAATGIGTIPVSVNAVSVVVAALVWPSGCLLLMRSLLPRSLSATLAVGVMAAAFPAFPLMMLTFGVLYPYALALALLPGALAFAFSLGQERAWRSRGIVFRSILLAVILVGIAFAQPAAAFAWAAMVLPLVIWRAIPAIRSVPGRRQAVWWVLLGLGLVAFAAVWIWFGRIGANSPWPTYTNPLWALVESVFQGFDGAIPSVVAGSLALLGVIDLIRRREKLWFVATWAVTVVLFVVAAAGPSWKLRAWVVGVFYRDPPRLSSLLVIAAVPMAVFGALFLWRLVQRFALPRLRLVPSSRGARSLGAGGLVVLVLATQLSPAMGAQLAWTARTYTDAEDAPILSGSERALIERIPEHVAEDAVIAGNPWTGAAFAYALTGRRMLNPHFNSYVFPEAAIINEHLNDALDDPAVCEAVRSAGVTHVLDFGSYFQDSGETGIRIDGATPYRGLRHLEEAGVAEEVDREGDAVLYRITACD
ncbi:hypothetical protein BJ978_001961 [Agromyces terreus]|uniref:Uncharacterized protein n=1 Tax=Agromyces terreus TaxID=424795 RepID=A0A9X2H261_9MICO|nr:DUF6541 family protein [Agromyces terreus]MCP2371285.1 hypothetical protein [Agromyces terreus]